MEREKEVPNILEQAGEVIENYYSPKEYSIKFTPDQFLSLTHVAYKAVSQGMKKDYDDRETENINNIYERLKYANMRANEIYNPDVSLPIDLTKEQVYLINEAYDEDSIVNPHRKNENKEIVKSMHKQVDRKDRKLF